MTDKELIREEIKRLKEESLEGKKNYYDYYDGVGDACDKMLQFINSLPEEPAIEDFEEEILNKWEDDPHTLWPKCPYCDFKNIAYKFANWQKQIDDKHIGDLQWEAYLKGEQETKQQMMKDAVDGFLVRDDDDYTAIYAKKPHRGKSAWVDDSNNMDESSFICNIRADLFPELEFTDEPKKVKLIILNNDDN